MSGREQITATLSYSLLFGTLLAAIGSYFILRAMNPDKGMGAWMGPPILFATAVLSWLAWIPLYIMFLRPIDPIGFYLIGLAWLVYFLSSVMENQGLVDHVGASLSRWQSKTLGFCVIGAGVGVYQLATSNIDNIAIAASVFLNFILLVWSIKILRSLRSEVPTSEVPPPANTLEKISGAAKMFVGIGWLIVIVVMTSRRWPHYESELLFRIVFSVLSAISAAIAASVLISGLRELLTWKPTALVRRGIIAGLTVAVFAGLFAVSTQGRAVQREAYEAERKQRERPSTRSVNPVAPVSNASPREKTQAETTAAPPSGGGS